MKKTTIKLNEEKLFQVIESFGMSTAWWGKMVGALPIKEEVMKLFYDKEEGIGLTNIRYNIGSGSMGKKYIKDPTRQSVTFEVSKGVYDFTKDQNTMSLIDLSIKYGCEEIVFFAISPLERMTRSKKVCGSNDKKNPSNHLKEYYLEYTDYILDIVEHFLSKGYPIKYVSPINEPQWEWGITSQSQEGCYYTKEEVRELYSLFVKRINERNIDIILTGHDGGEWITAIDYAKEMFKDPTIDEHMPQIDSHSYWTNADQKRKAKREFDSLYPNKKLVMSEWCEMKGGLDYGMDAALVLANVIHEDLTILNVVSWQYWTGIEQEKYKHKVALMYLHNQREAKPTKKLYSFGNYTKYIRPGYRRIEANTTSDDLLISSFIFQGNIVSVLINNSREPIQYDLPNYDITDYIITNKDYNLESIKISNQIPAKSIVTLLMKEV